MPNPELRLLGVSQWTWFSPPVDDSRFPRQEKLISARAERGIAVPTMPTRVTV
jgi:hypothetical protein